MLWPVVAAPTFIPWGGDRRVPGQLPLSRVSFEVGASYDRRTRLCDRGLTIDGILLSIENCMHNNYLVVDPSLRCKPFSKHKACIHISLHGIAQSFETTLEKPWWSVMDASPNVKCARQLTRGRLALIFRGCLDGGLVVRK